MLFPVLLFVHVVAGVLWVCGAVFFGLFVVPAAMEAGPGGAAVLGGILRRHFPQWMTLWSLLSVAAGLGLWVLDFAAKGGWAWVLRPEGALLSLAGLGALHALVKGLLVQRPAVLRVGALGAQVAGTQDRPDPGLSRELAEAQARVARLARSSAMELGGILALMAAHQILAQF